MNPRRTAVTCWMSAHCQQQWRTTLGEATPAVGSRGAFAAWHELIASAEVKNSARTSRNRSESASAERVNPSGEQQHLAWSIKDVPRRFTGDSVPRSFSLRAVVARVRRGTKPCKLRMHARRVHGTQHGRMGMAAFHLRVVFANIGLSACCCSLLDHPR